MEPSASASSCEDAAASSETDNEEKVIRERLRVIEMRKLEREKKKDAETRKKEEEKEFQKGLIAAMTNLADAVRDLTEVIKEDRKNFKVVGREVKVYYKDKGLCKGHVKSMSVVFEGEEGEYTVVDEPYCF